MQANISAPIDDESWAFHIWLTKQRYANSASLFPRKVAIFLKPPSPLGPTHEMLVQGLIQFGFGTKALGRRSFSALELRGMWRNLRSLEAWIDNMDVYTGFECPIYEVEYRYGATLPAIDAFKRGVRRQFGSSTDHVRNFLHAPENSFEAALHREIMSGTTTAPAMTTRDLRLVYQGAMERLEHYRGSGQFVTINSLLYQRKGRCLFTGLLGLCAITTDRYGSIERVEFWRRGEWVSMRVRDLGLAYTYRLLYDSTFITGDRECFLECLGYYESLVFRSVFKNETKGAAQKTFSIGEPMTMNSIPVALLLPPLTGNYWLNKAEITAAKEIRTSKSRYASE